MGIMDFIKGELLEIIEWTDDSRDTLSWRFPDEDKAIKNGAQLIVRESQVAQFVYLGEFGDTFRPGKHTLTTDNIPVLTKLKSWPFGFNSPFKADVYFVITRLFTGNKWGTSNPVMLRDSDFGIVRVRAFGTYDFKIVDAEDVPARGRRLRSQLPSRRVQPTRCARASSASSPTRSPSAKIPVLDVASRYTELGDALLPLINPAVTAKYGLEITSFIVENVSVPPEVEQAIDKRSSMAAVGNLNDFVKYQMGKGFESGGGGGAAGTAAELAVGFGLAQQMMQRRIRRRPRHADRGAAGRRRRGAALPELLSPAEAAQALGVSRSRRDGGARVRRAEGQEDRIDVAHLRARRSPATCLSSARDRATSRAIVVDQISALEKHECPACGAQAEWNPAKQKLVCPFCGTESPYQHRSRDRARSSSSISSTALRELPDEERGWQTERRSVQCQSCRAVMVFDPARVGQNCEFCGSPALVDYQEIKAPIRPQGVLPFAIDAQPRARRHPPLVAQQVVRAGPAGAQRRSSTPSTASTSRTGPSTRRCTARGTRRRATTTTSTSQARDSKGSRSCAQERRVRWEPAVGRRRSRSSTMSRCRDAGAADRSAAAGRAVSDAGSRAVRHGVSLRPRRRALPGGAARRRAASRRSRCTPSSRRCARSRFPATRTATCRFIPTFSGRTFKHVLVPVWLLTYNYGAEAVSGDRQRLHRAASPASIRTAPGRSSFAVARGDHRRGDPDSVQQPIASAEAEASAPPSSFHRCRPSADAERTL